MKLGREVIRHNELDNWRNTHRFESVMATKWLLLTISETEPGLWDRLRSLSHRLVGELSNTGVGGMRLNRGWPVQFHRPLVDPQKGRLLS